MAPVEYKNYLVSNNFKIGYVMENSNNLHLASKIPKTSKQRLSRFYKIILSTFITTFYVLCLLGFIGFNNPR